MSKQEDWWPSSRAAILVILGLATGTAVVQRSPGAPTRSSSATAAAEPSATAHASGLVAAEHVIELLADAIGVDLDNVEAREAAATWRDYLCLKTPAKPDHAHARMMAALDAVVVDLGGRPHAEIHPYDARVIPLQLADALSAIRAHTTFEDADAGIKKRQALVTDYYATANPKTNVEMIERKARLRRIRVKFLVTMLPDYVDSQTRRLFDSGLAGIQQAAGALDYTFDRFHLPGWSAHDQPGTRPSSAHDSEPGAVLFRRTPEHPDERFASELLLVLVVTEMPTLGVHRNALTSSIALIDAWHDAQGGDVTRARAELRVLGPFFSGSVASLKDVLDSLNDKSPNVPRKVQIVTGTATDPTIARSLAVTVGNEPVTFESIVPNNTDVHNALLLRLAELNPKWQCGSGIALLVESNTRFGQSMDEQADMYPVKGDDGKRCPQPLRVRFPLHISHLRASVDADTTATSLLQPAIKLRLTESTQPVDLIPSMTPDLTASVVDSAVDNLLAALKRERFSAIGIFATDARDHLFLARRIAKAIPDVLMFGTQSDLLYINREYAPFLRGTLIASSYPVFNQTQLLSSGTNMEPRRQFTTASEQGAYNATLTLLAETRAERNKLVDAKFETCTPAKACARPLWLSVIGSKAIWPIARTSAVDARLTASEPRDRPVTAAPPSIVAAAMTVFAVALVHLFGLLVALKAPKTLSHQHPHRPHHLSSKQDVAEAAKDVAAMCHWQNSRAFWNFYPPSDVARPVTPPHPQGLARREAL